ncbi:MAG: TolC family protein [Pseudomonadota bacterium]
MGTLFFGILLGVFPGCANVQKEPGFLDIKHLASQRLGKRLDWREKSPEAPPAEKVVQQLLQEPLTADAAVQIALLNNRELRAAYETLGIAQADLIEAAMPVNPVLSGSAAFGPSIEWEAALVQNVLNLLTLASRKRAGEAEFERTKLDVARQVVNLAAEIRSAYFTAVANMQILEMWRTAITATEAAAALSERQVQAGNQNRLEQSSHQIFYAQTLLEGARTELQIRRDREQLNRLMGLWGTDTRWRLLQRLPVIPPDLPALDRLEVRVVENSLEIAAAKKEIEALRITLDLAKKYRYLSVLGIGTHREPDGQFTGPRLELSLPLFDRGRSRIARLEAELEKSRQRLVATATEIRATAREARTRLMATHAQVKFFQDVLLPLKQTVVGETQLRYNGMLIGVYDLLQAKQVNTGRDYITAIRDFWLAWSDLEGIVGTRLMSPAIPLRDATEQPLSPSSPRLPPHEHHRGENEHEAT